MDDTFTKIRKRFLPPGWHTHVQPQSSGSRRWAESRPPHTPRPEHPCRQGEQAAQPCRAALQRVTREGDHRGACATEASTFIREEEGWGSSEKERLGRLSWTPGRTGEDQAAGRVGGHKHNRWCSRSLPAGQGSSVGGGCLGNSRMSHGNCAWQLERNLSYERILEQDYPVQPSAMEYSIPSYFTCCLCRT